MIKIRKSRFLRGINGGFFFHVLRWQKSLRWSHKLPCGHWRIEFNLFPIYTSRAHLINNFRNEKEYIGIGMDFPHKGKMAKVALRLENDFSVDDFKRGWEALQKAVEFPERPESKVIFNNNCLTGKELTVPECLKTKIA